MTPWFGSKTWNFTVALIASLLMASAQSAVAQTVNVSDDTNINLASPAQLNGSASSLFVRNIGAGGERHTFLQFDLASLPTGTQVSKAMLRLWVSAVNDPGQMNVHAVLDPWAEETLSASVSPPLGPLVASFAVAAGDQDQFVLIDITSLVQGWIDGSIANAGLALVPVAADPLRITLDSKETTTTGHAPELEVAISPSEVGDISAVNPGTGLTGGGATGDVTVSLDTAFTDVRYALAPHGHTVSQVTGAATLGSNNFTGEQHVSGRMFAIQGSVPASAIGQHTAASGQSIGVAGISNSTGGTGVEASAAATSGQTTGLLSYVDSASGTAAVFENRAGGDLIKGTSISAALKFRVDGTGAVFADSYRDLAGNPIVTGTGDITAVGVGTGLSGGGAAGDVTVALDTTFTDARYAPAVHGHDVSQVTNAATLAANAFTGTQTIDTGNLDLDPSTAGGGNVTKNGQLFLHNRGTDNVFVGSLAGSSTSIGSGNAAVGARALQDNTTGTNNTAIGMNALFKNTTSQGNTAAGTNALVNNTTGGANTAIGSFAMQGNTTGSVNIAIGPSSLSTNTTGSRNIAAGSAAMQANISGNDNTGLGHSVLARNTNGNRNTASGYQALFWNTVGVGNTALGADALQNTTGSSNIAIGQFAGFNATTGSNNIYLGANVQGVGGESDAMYLGRVGTHTKTVIAGVRGTTVSGGEVVLIDVDGRLGSGSMAVGSDSVGSAQVIDESLTASDLGPSSVTGSELAAGSVTADKVAFNYAGSATVGGPALDVACVGCVAASEVAFSFAGNGANTFTGTQTIDSGNLDLDFSSATVGNITKNGNRFLHNFGSGNTFLGMSSGNFTMTGSGNTAAGAGVFQQNTTGSGNTAMGDNALFVNTMGDRNTAIGAATLIKNTTGSDNTATGTGALFENFTGARNTATGENALSNNSTGNNNVAVGQGAGALATTGSNNIYLGAGVVGVAGESNTMYLGLQGTQTKAFIAGIRGITTVNPDAIPVMIDSAGQLGTVSSSRRFKDDIRDMAEASRRLFSLRPVTFRYKQAFGDGSRPMQYGLIAEEVAEAFPELAVRRADGTVETVHYERLNVLLLNELQRMQRDAMSQRERLATLERQLDDLLQMLRER